jgi:prophage DNA circulation protein
MAETKKTKQEPATSPGPSPLESAWTTLIGLTDDARTELHKQTGAVIALTDSALDGLTRFAASANDRLNALAAETLAAADQSGRRLAAVARASAADAITATRESANQIARTTRGAAERASATARALVGPAEAKAA